MDGIQFFERQTEQLTFRAFDRSYYTIPEIIIFHIFFCSFSFYRSFVLIFICDSVFVPKRTMWWNIAKLLLPPHSLNTVSKEKRERQKKTISWQQRLVNCDPWPSRARLGLPFLKCCVNGCVVCACDTHKIPFSSLSYSSISSFHLHFLHFTRSFHFWIVLLLIPCSRKRRKYFHIP